MYCLNTLYTKTPQRKWTWISPYKRYKNEIDYIFSNNRRLSVDVFVLNQFDTARDHRLVRARLIHKTRFPTNEIITQIIQTKS